MTSPYRILLVLFVHQYLDWMRTRKFVTDLNSPLVITSIDIQSVEPVDHRTRDALQKSVQLAIKITTNSEEAGVFCELHYIARCVL